MDEPAGAPPCLGDWVILARDLDQAEAYPLVSLLTSAGICAELDDIHAVQVGLALAMGGVKIRVPQSQLAQARQLLAAFNRGEFALGDDFDAESGERPDDGENPS